MRIPGKLFGFTVFFTVIMLMAAPSLMAAFGSSGQRPEDATPPYGLKIEGDAKGTKLNGAIMVEYYNIHKAFEKVVPIPDPANPLNCRGVVSGGLCCGSGMDLTAMARVVLRLRQGSTGKNIFTYFADVGPISLSGDPADIQMAIQDDIELKNAILEDFFNVTDGSMTVVLRGISEFGVIDIGVATDLSGDPTLCDAYDIDWPDPSLQCTEECGGSRFLLADIVITVR